MAEKKMAPIFTNVLIPLLGRVDAAFLPIRSWEARWPANATIARRQYREHGLPWRSGGLSEATRKARQRGLEELAAAALVRLSKPGRRLKVLAVKLTEAGELQARRAVGLPGIGATWAAMSQLRGYSPTKWVYEAVMAGCDPRTTSTEEWGVNMRAEQDMLLPALLRSWVEGHGDCKGRVYYRLTPAGLKYLDATPEEPEGVTTKHNHDELLETYRESLCAELEAFSTRKPEVVGEIGPPPLPVSMGHDTTYWPAGYFDEGKK